jgi:hypothetical protein
LEFPGVVNSSHFLLSLKSLATPGNSEKHRHTELLQMQLLRFCEATCTTGKEGLEMGEKHGEEEGGKEKGGKELGAGEGEVEA